MPGIVYLTCLTWCSSCHASDSSPLIYIDFSSHVRHCANHLLYAVALAPKSGIMDTTFLYAVILFQSQALHRPPLIYSDLSSQTMYRGDHLSYIVMLAPMEDLHLSITHTP